MLLFALVIMASLFTGCNQRIEQAPDEVLSAFETMFPGATHIEWSRQISTFTANFYHEQHEKQAQFDLTFFLKQGAKLFLSHVFSGHMVNLDFQDQCITGILRHIALNVISFRKILGTNETQQPILFYLFGHL